MKKKQRKGERATLAQTGSVRRNEKGDRERGKMGFSFLSKIYIYRAVGFRRSEKKI